MITLSNISFGTALGNFMGGLCLGFVIGALIIHRAWIKHNAKSVMAQKEKPNYYIQTRKR
jgi:hypothetical protein